MINIIVKNLILYMYHGELDVLTPNTQESTPVFLTTLASSTNTFKLILMQNKQI